MRKLALRSVVLGGGVSYWEYARRQFNLGLLPLWDASGTVATDLNGMYNGTYKGTYSLSQPGPLAGKNGITVNAGAVKLSTSISAVLGGDELSVVVWAKASDVGLWTDGADRYIISLYSSDLSCFVKIFKPAAGGLRFEYDTDSTARTIPPLSGSLEQVNWMQLAITASRSTNKFTAYLNGGPFTTLAMPAAAWSGGLHANFACAGALRSDSYASPWIGGLAFCGLSNQVLSGATIRDLHDRVYPTRGLMVLGDSKSAADSWTRLLADGLQTATSIRWQERPWALNRYAVPGNFLSQGLTAVNTLLPTEWEVPHVAWINFGANDVGDAGEFVEATWKANLTSMIDALRAKWGIPVYVTRPWRRNYGAQCNTLATWIAAVVGTYASGVYVGDDERVWLEGGDNGVTMTTDGIHYSAAGEAAAAAAKLAAMGY